jgi:CelD/BcsL family acetyltransferase involved in cellulose biosynthesis
VGAQVADLFDPVGDSRAAALLSTELASLSGRYLAVWLPLLSDLFIAGGFRDFLQKNRIPCLIRRRAARLQIDLARYPDFEAYAEATFQSRTRQGLRRKQRRLEQQGVVEFAVCETAQELEQELPAVMRLERASWKHAGRAGIFKDSAHNAFYFILLQELSRRGRVRLSLLRVGGSLAAFELGVLGTRGYCMHTTAFDPRFAPFSPGRLLALFVVAKCFEAGVAQYDFMQNEQVFKRQMANREENFHDCILPRSGLLGRLILLVIRMLDFWKSGRRKPDSGREPRGA